MTKSRRVLLLEDQYLVRSGMKALIQLADPTATVVEVAGFQQAVDALQRESFDIGFLDYNLGDQKSGLDLLQYLKEHQVPMLAVMVSAADDAEVVRSCLDAGACGFIPKARDESRAGGTAGEDVFRVAIDTVFRDCLYLPSNVLGRSGHAPTGPAASRPATLASFGLTPRQSEVVLYLCQGLSNKGIANRMGISENTVRKDYVSQIFRAFGVAKRTQLIIEISRRGVSIPLGTS